MGETTYTSHNYRVIFGSTADVRRILSVPGVSSMHRSGDVVTVSHTGTPEYFTTKLYETLEQSVILEHIPERQK